MAAARQCDAADGRVATMLWVVCADAVKLFFRRSNHNDVVSHRWLQRNDTRLQIFGMK